jgi:DNA repair protein RadC
MTVRIKDLQTFDRPRERLIKYGADYLTDEELIAILLKTGTKKHSAKDLATILLNEIDGINNLNSISYEKLISIEGIKQSKACDIMAAVELSRRINDIKDIQNVKFNNCEVVYNYYKNKIAYELQEHFYCVYLDTNKRIIKEKLLFKGTLNYSIVHPREVFKEAYLVGASAIICVHNHPSGNVLPSKQDLDITKSLQEVGSILGIKIVDHIIVGKNNYYSFLQNNDI